MIWNWTWSTDFSIIAIIGWIIPLVMLFFVPVNRKPSSATAWLMLIFLLPYIGLIIFLLIGSPKLSRRRRAQQRTMDSLISKAIAEAEQQPELTALLQPVIPHHYEPFVTLNTNLGFLPAFGGNSVELLPNYNDVFQRIAEEIEAAKKFVHIEYFALSRDKETECVFAAMERAVSRGIKVRVLMDHLGSRKYPNFKKMRAQLTAAGIENHLMLQLHFFGSKYSRPDLRNHRKIVVIDGQVAFTGSQNLIKRNYFRKDAIYYEDLLNAGVKIYHYNAPILLHSKLISVDDDIAVIGSSNLDIRSFQLNLEVTLVCYDAGVVADLRQIESAYIRKSSLVNIDEWKTRTVKEKLFENISRLTAALQ